MKQFASEAMRLLVGMSLGFGISQASLAFTVRVNSEKIATLRNDVDTIRASTAAHMKEAVELFRSTSDEHERTTRQLIEIVKVQNALLQKFGGPP